MESSPTASSGQSYAEPASDADRPAWRPVSAIDRRVLGVLVEKAKTVPASYPLTVNALCTGANQKNNRSPEMELAPQDVQESLDRLRLWGAVGEVQGDGRAVKYRHYLYKWLGVDKVELAVMAELLLRGPQTVGELRSRASRMEPIADLAALRPVLESLVEKGLVVALSPQGRGQVVTHALYLPEELARQREQYGRGAGEACAGAEAAGGAARIPVPSGNAAGLRAEIDQLRQELALLRREVEELRNARV
jgi:hypothetical protein